MPTKRFTIVPAVYLLLEKDGKILLGLRSNTGYEDGNYSLPAGHVEGNETMLAAMCREAKEELGILLKEEELSVCHFMHRKTKDREGNHEERVDVFMVVKNYEGEVCNAEPDKCSELRWVVLNDLPKNTILCVRHALEAITRGEFYSEFGWE